MDSICRLLCRADNAWPRTAASSRPVQWYFDNLLPEEALRTVIAKDAGLSAEDAFGLLAYFGAESAGSLVLRDPRIAIPAETGVRPLSLQELNARILNLPTHRSPKTCRKRMSLAGAAAQDAGDPR